MSTRRRLESSATASLRSPARVSARGTPTVPLRAAEVLALVQHAAVATDAPADPASPTVEMVALEPTPPPPRLARGSEPVRGARGTRRSRELLRVDEIKRGPGRGGGGR